jgi:hypothetical protein
VMAFANPEAYIFGMKLGSKPAVVYLLIDGALGIAITYTLLRSSKVGIIASIFYFLYNFVESVITSLLLYYKFSFSYISALGLVLSTILLGGNAERNRAKTSKKQK